MRKIQVCQHGAYALLPLSSQNLFVCVFTLLAACPVYGSHLFIFFSSRRRAQGINPMVHRSTVEPPGNVAIGNLRQRLAIKLQEGFVRNFFSLTTVAQQTTESGDNPPIMVQKEFLKTLIRG